jgi:DEP domain-containing protein 5
MLHHDIIHNASTCFHFELQWIGTTARCIDDTLRQWSRAIEKYGLRLVEGYVTQISDIQDRNPFQSCYPVPLSLEPPTVPDLQSKVNEGTQVFHYFESALLRKLGYVLDIEARSSYSDRVEVVYSYRRSPFKYSQWVHRSGVAFVQVLGGKDGFLFLTNRLLAPGKLGPVSKQYRSGSAAEEVRRQLQQTCSDVEGLAKFYKEELAGLDTGLEEPPPLHI